MTQHVESFVETTENGTTARYRTELEQKEAIDSLFSSMFDNFVDVAHNPENQKPQPVFDTVFDPETYEPKWVQVGENEPVIDVVLRDLRLYVKGSFDADQIAIDPTILNGQAMSRDQYVDAYIGHNVELAMIRRAERLQGQSAELEQYQAVQPAHITEVDSDPESETNRSFGDMVKELAGRALSAVKMEFHSAKIDLTGTHTVQPQEHEQESATV